MEKTKSAPKWLIIYIINAMIILLTCSLMLNIHFSSDTYDIWTTTDNNVDIHLRDGRFASAALYYILAKLGINVAKSQIWLTLIFIFTVAAIVTFLTAEVVKLCKTPLLSALITIDSGFMIIFHNVFISEWYMFPEVMLMYAVSMAGVTAAAFAFMKMCTVQKAIAKVRMGLISFLSLLIALGMYQVSIGIFITLLLVLIYINPDIKKKLICSVGGLCLGAVNCFLNIIIVKVLTIAHIMAPTTRGASADFGIICSNIAKIISQQREVIGGHHIFHRYTFLIYIMLLIALLIVPTLKKSQDKWKRIALAMLFTVIIYVGSYIPHFVSSDYWLSQRTLVPIFGVFAFLAIAGAVQEGTPRVRRLSMIVMVSFLLINSLVMENIFANRLAVDDMDTSYAKAINSYIQRYAAETGVEIHSIATQLDENPTWSYDGIKYVSYDINVKNMVRSWAYIPLINTATDSTYQACDMNVEIWNEYFAGKDWDQFLPEEQIVFQDDVAYIAIY